MKSRADLYNKQTNKIIYKCKAKTMTTKETELFLLVKKDVF